VVVAAGQLQSRLMNEAASTLEAIDGLVTEAARQKARLLVLPECAYPAYLLGSAESYRGGQHLFSGEFVDWLSARARETRLHIVCGYVEDTGEALFNAAVLIGPDGRTIGRTRKHFLWHVDREWFTPGSKIAAFDTELGRIGIIICAEARMPEIIATLAADGAELIAMPTCWINTSRQPGEFRNPQPEFMIEARASEFGLPFICADKAGLELTTGYVGQSCIASADGSMLAKAPAVGETLIVTTIEPAPAAPLSIDDAYRKRLLSADPPRQPGRTAACLVTLAAISKDEFKLSAFSCQLSAGMRAEIVEALVSQRNAASQSNVGPARVGVLAGPPACAGIPSRTVEVGPARVGMLAGRELKSFAASRALALDGAEVLVYFDADDDEPMLRTRAVENRVFAVGLSARVRIIIGPDGTMLARGTADAAAEAQVDLAEASNKLVALNTDIFAERRVELYRF
jgi:predicted amidohydrolase